LYFDKPETNKENGFEIADAAYRLRISRCFRQSQMTCLTCHDPHFESHNKQAEAAYVKTCERCHSKVTHKERLSEGETCVSCHMPKRRGEFALNVILTDHYIQRNRPPVDRFDAPKKQASSPGRLVPYYPERPSEDESLYLAVAESENKSDPSAIAALESAVRNYAPAESGFYAAIAEAYVRDGRYADAVPWFEEAQKRQPEDRSITGRLVEALLQTGELNRAEQVLKAVSVQGQADAETLTNLGNVYVHQGQLQEAESALHQSLQLDPELAQTYNLLGGVKEIEGDQIEANRLYREAIRLSPDLAEAHNNLARSLAANSEFGEAEFEFKQALADAPQFADAHHNYGLLLVATTRREKGEEQLREAARLNPRSAVFHSDLADLLTERQDEKEAIQEYKRALELNPSLDSANVGLGRALIRTGDTQSGRSYCQAALRSSDPSVVDLARSCLVR
jgi:tetratricopeptide (TPR) repeat protein